MILLLPQQSQLMVFLLLKSFLLHWSIFRLYLLFPLTSSIFVLYFSNKERVCNIYPTPTTSSTSPPPPPPMHHAMHQLMHGPAGPSTKIPIPPHLTCRQWDYIILLLHWGHLPSHFYWAWPYLYWLLPVLIFCFWTLPIPFFFISLICYYNCQINIEKINCFHFLALLALRLF